jgi:chromosome segregation ATPase
MPWTIDTLKEYVDQRLTDNDKAVSAALQSVKEQTRSSFEASEKAIVKAEEAQKSYNQTHNDLSRKLDTQNKETMPRPEIEARFASLDEKLSELRNTVSAGGGIVQGGKAFKDESRANIAIVISAIGLLAVLIRWLLTAPK